MAEEDWYGPFTKLNAWHGYAASAAIAGLYIVICGAIGYELGKRSWVVGTVPPTAWRGGILWQQVLVGSVLLVVAVICHVIGSRKPK
jgi:hypothetical protein